MSDTHRPAPTPQNAYVSRALTVPRELVDTEPKRLALEAIARRRLMEALLAEFNRYRP